MRFTTGVKRQREATRDRRKKEKAERLARNRARSANGTGPSEEDDPTAAEALPEVKLEDINVSGVAPRGPKGSNGPRRLFVGGLSWDTSGAQLQSAFSQFGEVLEAAVIKDRNTGKSRGFGFVTFREPLEAAAAAKAMDGADIDGRHIKVNPAEDR